MCQWLGLCTSNWGEVGVQVRSLVGELRSYMPFRVAKENNNNFLKPPNTNKQKDLRMSVSTAAQKMKAFWGQWS